MVLENKLKVWDKYGCNKEWRDRKYVEKNELCKLGVGGRCKKMSKH